MVMIKSHGLLTKWNDERGFGFITLQQSEIQVFVHVSSFPRDGVRPALGELLSFEIDEGADGKKRAIHVERASIKKPVKKMNKTNSSGDFLSKLIIFLVIIAALLFVYDSHFSQENLEVNTMVQSVELTSPVREQDQQFHCDGRTHCSQMTSCAEATYFLRNCSGTEMDGNGDGEPCEQQRCH